MALASSALGRTMAIVEDYPAIATELRRLPGRARPLGKTGQARCDVVFDKPTVKNVTIAALVAQASSNFPSPL
jgi:hypothetical protein